MGRINPTLMAPARLLVLPVRLVSFVSWAPPPQFPVQQGLIAQTRGLNLRRSVLRVPLVSIASLLLLILLIVLQAPTIISLVKQLTPIVGNALLVSSAPSAPPIPILALREATGTPWGQSHRVSALPAPPVIIV